MPAKTEKVNVLHHLEASFKVVTTINEPVANINDDNVQVYVLSHIPDNLQRVAYTVLVICQNHQESILLQIYLKKLS